PSVKLKQPEITTEISIQISRQIFDRPFLNSTKNINQTFLLITLYYLPNTKKPTVSSRGFQ
ncbi:hypothetical protein, partial [Cellulophaga sp. E16_2]|uniref:hypothetical protein n=1 Tax=Cellulophaga sp. E16_2 TaxID=2789297 RepID=UPI001A917131